MQFVLDEFMDEIGVLAYSAEAGPYSFAIVYGDDGWTTSWKLMGEDGSASDTIEGPFGTREEAEANCREIYAQLQASPSD